MDDFILTISAEATTYKLKEVLLDNLVNDAIEQVTDLAYAKGIQIRELSSSNSIFIMANTRLLVRAFVNLLLNAIKFSPSNCQITMAISPDSSNRTVYIAISNPVDITDDVHDMTPSMHGFGLGLDFADIVIRKHQGKLIRDIPAQSGTACIHIDFPCVIHPN